MMPEERRRPLTAGDLFTALSDAHPDDIVIIRTPGGGAWEPVRTYDSGGVMFVIVAREEGE